MIWHPLFTWADGGGSPPPAPEPEPTLPPPRQRTETYAYDVEGLVEGNRGRITQKYHSIDVRIMREDREILTIITKFLDSVTDES